MREEEDPAEERWTPADARRTLEQCEEDDNEDAEQEKYEGSAKKPHWKKSRAQQKLKKTQKPKDNIRDLFPDNTVSFNTCSYQDSYILIAISLVLHLWRKNQRWKKRSS